VRHSTANPNPFLTVVVAKRKTLFDDRPVEISVSEPHSAAPPILNAIPPQELTFIIKQDIANINKQLATLQAHVKAQQAGRTTGSKQIEEHNANVVTLLQSKLMSTSMTFKDVLEIRTQVCPHLAPCGQWLSPCPEHEGDQRPDTTICTFHLFGSHPTTPH
jgi:hypothetical protein